MSKVGLHYRPSRQMQDTTCVRAACVHFLVAATIPSGFFFLFEEVELMLWKNRWEQGRTGPLCLTSFFLLFRQVTVSSLQVTLNFKELTWNSIKKKKNFKYSSYS